MYRQKPYWWLRVKASLGPSHLPGVLASPTACISSSRPPPDPRVVQSQAHLQWVLLCCRSCQRGCRSANVAAGLPTWTPFLLPFRILEVDVKMITVRATVCQPVYQPHPMPGFLITKTPRDVSESEPTPGSVSFEALGQSHGRKFLWAWRLNAKARTL